MEDQPKELPQPLAATDANTTLLSSPVNNATTNSAASPSKVFIITPEQIAKLGLTQQIKIAVESQVSPKTPVKKRPRVTKMNIIDVPSPTDSVTSKVNQVDDLLCKSAKNVEKQDEIFKKPNADFHVSKKTIHSNIKCGKMDHSIRKQIATESISKSSVKKLDNTSKTVEEKESVNIMHFPKSNTKQLMKNCDSLKDTVKKHDEKGILKYSGDNINTVSKDPKSIITIRNQNDFEQGSLKQEKPVIPGSQKNQGATVPPAQPSISNPVISSMKSKLLSILESRGSFTEKKSNTSNIPGSSKSIDEDEKKPVCKSKAIPKPSIVSKKRKQEGYIQPLPEKISKSTIPEAIIVATKTTKIQANCKYPLKQSMSSVSITEEEKGGDVGLVLPNKEIPRSSPHEVVAKSSTIITNKAPLKRQTIKAVPNISKISKIRKKTVEHPSVLISPEDVAANHDLSLTHLPTEIPETLEDIKPQKIHVLSNEQISLPQTYIDQMLKKNFNQKPCTNKSPLKEATSAEDILLKNDVDTQKEEINLKNDSPVVENIETKKCVNPEDAIHLEIGDMTADVLEKASLKGTKLETKCDGEDSTTNNCLENEMSQMLTEQSCSDIVRDKAEVVTDSVKVMSVVPEVSQEDFNAETQKSNMPTVDNIDKDEDKNSVKFVGSVELVKNSNETQVKGSDEVTIMETIISVRGTASDITVTKVPHDSHSPKEGDTKISPVESVSKAIKKMPTKFKCNKIAENKESFPPDCTENTNGSTSESKHLGKIPEPLNVTKLTQTTCSKSTVNAKSPPQCTATEINTLPIEDLKKGSVITQPKKRHINKEELSKELEKIGDINESKEEHLQEPSVTNTTHSGNCLKKAEIAVALNRKLELSEGCTKELTANKGKSEVTKIENESESKDASYTNKIPELSGDNQQVIATPRKRGRKKKSEAVVEVKPELCPAIDASDTNKIPELSGDNQHVIATPKKRGRKKKSEPVVEVKPELCPAIDASDTNKIPELSSDNQQVIATPKKRGRKKKSEAVVEVKPELCPAIPTIEVNISKRSGRKRQVVDYFALAEGADLGEEKKRKRSKIERTSKAIKIEDNENIEEGSSTSSTAKSDNLDKINEEGREASATEREIVNPGVSPNVSATGHEITLIRIEEGNASDVIVKRKISQPMLKEPVYISKSEGPKRKTGRPRGKQSNNPLNCKVMNSIFHHINTPTAQANENKETEEIAPLPINFVNVSMDNGTSTTEGTSMGIKVKQDPGDTVTCAVCYKELERTVWQYHRMRHHNNLAWRVGEPPIDLNDQKLVISILTDLYKRKKPLFCETCGQSKKSVMGFLSHKSVCQKSMEEVAAMRLKCEYCDNTVLPVSMVAHLKLCKGLNPEKDFSLYQQQAILDSPCTGKRKAATKAEKLIKVFKDDETLGTVGEGNVKKGTRNWFVNFDFHPTFFGKRRIQTEITENGTAKCLFEGCEFQNADMLEMANHIWACSKKPTEGYTCKFCIVTYKTEGDVMEHMEETHWKPLHAEVQLDEDEESDEDIVHKEEFIDDIQNVRKCIVKPYVKAGLLHGIKFLLIHRYCSPTTGIAYPPAIDWTIAFCQQHFCIPNLFPNWRINATCYEKLSPDIIIKYLPRLRYSASTARMETKKFVDPLKLDYDWKRYKLFESEMLHNGTSIMFCGGSIFAMAWAPTPYDQPDCEQILAVSTNSDMNREYTLYDAYREPGLIQFWNCGLLNNSEVATDKPRLQFCIAHDYGPAWSLEWCPSGCYDIERSAEYDSLQRLGLLAVGCADSNIYVYSVCFPNQIGGKIVKQMPVLKLVMDSVAEATVSGIEAHVTKISWSKAAGHQFVAAGYANGMVAIYDLNTTSVLLRVGPDQNGVETIMPYRVFNAHYHAVTALSLYHLNDGRRWLMTGSIDRSIKYWDLENPTIPITNFTKLIVTDGVWLNHWLSTIQTFDDSCGGGLTYTAAHQLRNFESEATSVMHSNSRVNAITGSEWTNGFVQGNIVGEVKGFFPHQMFYSMDGDKSYKIKKAILGYARLVEKNLSIQERLKEEQEKLKHVNSKPTQVVDDEKIIKTKTFVMNTDYTRPEPVTYKEAEERYGLVFCDMRVNSMKEFPANIDSYFKSNNANKLYASRPNVYPMQSINKMALNPNQGSFMHLATGYHVGFVRISCLRFLNEKLNPI